MGNRFSRFASAASKAAGSWQAFTVAGLGILLWLLAGLYYGYANQLYQLIINTITTIITFLMVFLIQNSQNRDTAALNLKLDELIRANENARNAIAGVETLSEEEIAQRRALMSSLL
jgi:low affinity Fe/Cu permease